MLARLRVRMDVAADFDCLVKNALGFASEIEFHFCKYSYTPVQPMSWSTVKLPHASSDCPRKSGMNHLT